MQWQAVLKAWPRGAMLLVLVWTIPMEVRAQQLALPVPALVFDRVTVVDLEQGRLVPGQRVVIAGNRIQAVGSGSNVAVPPGAQIVDAKGKYLMPGLWDMHTHNQRDPTDTLLIANGVTGVRNAHSALPLKTQVQQWREVLAGTRIGPPRQLLAGQSFGQHYNYSDSAAVERIIDSLKAAGANFLKVYPYSATVAAAARRAGIPFGGHLEYLNYMGGGYVEAPETVLEASDAGMRIFDHAPKNLDTDCFGRGGKADVARCQAIAERFRRNDSWSVPTVAQGMGKSPYVERASTLFDKGAQLPLQGLNWLREAASQPIDEKRHMRVAHQVGLPILAGTDRSPHGFMLHAELATLVATGLTPLEALQSATLNPAKLLSGTDSLGTVAAGKLADLVLLDADPLADITNTTTIRAVVANGRYFDRAALDQMLVAVQNKKPKQQTPKQEKPEP